MALHVIGIFMAWQAHSSGSHAMEVFDATFQFWQMECHRPAFELTSEQHELYAIECPQAKVKIDRDHDRSVVYYAAVSRYLKRWHADEIFEWINIQTFVRILAIVNIVVFGVLCWMSTTTTKPPDRQQRQLQQPVQRVVYVQNPVKALPFLARMSLKAPPRQTKRDLNRQFLDSHEHHPLSH